MFPIDKQIYTASFNFQRSSDTVNYLNFIPKRVMWTLPSPNELGLYGFQHYGFLFLKFGDI